MGEQLRAMALRVGDYERATHLVPCATAGIGASATTGSTGWVAAAALSTPVKSEGRRTAKLERQESSDKVVGGRELVNLCPISHAAPCLGEDAEDEEEEPSEFSEDDEK